MKMAADSNMNFHHGAFPSNFYNQHVVSFQSGAVNSSSGMMMQEGMNSSGGFITAGGMIVAGNLGSLSNTSVAMVPPGGYPPPGNILMEPVPTLKHDTGLAVDWSFNEQAILNDGLIKFADEPGMLKYIKIAALLPEKTVRDVALRCQWMTKKENVKRRKLEENYTGRKIKDRKDKMVNSSAKANVYSVPPDNGAGYPFMMHQTSHNNLFSCEVPTIDGATWQLLEENAQVLNQISANIATYKLEDNIDLFSHTRNNITGILNSMSKMPGIMSQMPPLPVSINEDLMNTILPSSSQALMFGTLSSINMKKEPRC